MAMEPAVRRVAQALQAAGLRAEPLLFPRSTRTAEEAAAAVGCALGQIVKTLVFLADGRCVLVLVAGDRRVDATALAKVLGLPRKRVRMATAEEVEAATGYDVGGVPPVGHEATYAVLIDDSLRRFEVVWAAAGTANAVFAVNPDDLARATRGQWARIALER